MKGHEPLCFAMDAELKHAVYVGENALRSVRSYLCIRHGAVVQEPKGGTEIVTEADHYTERRILTQLREAFPDWKYHAEESGGDDVSRSGMLWAIDPIDGTTNFSSGVPQFATMLTLMDGPNLVMSLVYDPLRDLMFRAIAGEGATLNGDPISVSTRTDLDRAQMLYEVGYLPGQREFFYDVFETIGQRVRTFRRLGCSGISGALIAQGGFDVLLSFGTHPLHDCAPIALLIREAGGVVTDLRGNDWSVETPSREMLACTPAFQEPMLAFIKQSVLHSAQAA